MPFIKKVAVLHLQRTTGRGSVAQLLTKGVA